MEGAAMSANTIRGVLSVGLLAQLYVRADSRKRNESGPGWGEVEARVRVLVEQVADREVIEALPTSSLRDMFSGLLNSWPARDVHGVAPSAALLRLLSLVECVFGEVRDAAMKPEPYVVRNVQGFGHIKMEPGEIQWDPDRTLCCPPAVNPERQLEPEVTRGT
jgi:hypothetical protein